MEVAGRDVAGLAAVTHLRPAAAFCKHLHQRAGREGAERFVARAGAGTEVDRGGGLLDGTVAHDLDVAGADVARAAAVLDLVEVPALGDDLYNGAVLQAVEQRAGRGGRGAHVQAAGRDAALFQLGLGGGRTAVCGLPDAAQVVLLHVADRAVVADLVEVAALGDDAHRGVAGNDGEAGAFGRGRGAQVDRGGGDGLPTDRET